MATPPPCSQSRTSGGNERRFPSDRPRGRHRRMPAPNPELLPGGRVQEFHVHRPVAMTTRSATALAAARGLEGTRLSFRLRAGQRLRGAVWSSIAARRGAGGLLPARVRNRGLAAAARVVSGSRAGGVRRTASCSSRSRQVIPRKPTTSCMRNRRCRRASLPHDQLGQRGPDGTHSGSHRRELGQCVQVADRGGPRRPRPVPARPGGRGSTRPGLAEDPRLCLADGCLSCLREGMSPAAVALAGY